MSRVLFLDYDGCIRLDLEPFRKGFNPQFCPDRMKLVSRVAREIGASIVVTSDSRHIESEEENKRMLAPILTPLLHQDWRTTVTGRRWNEVQAWLVAHPEVSEYAIIEDFDGHFDGAPFAMRNRIIWCNPSYGYTPVLAGRTLSLFKP